MKRSTSNPSSFIRWLATNLSPWREIAFGTLVLLEVSWLLPWFYLLSAPQHNTSAILAGVVLGGVIISCYAVMKWLVARRIVRVWRVITLALVLLLGLFAGSWLVLEKGTPSLLGEITRWAAGLADRSVLLPQPLVLLLLILLAFWRGIVITQGMLGPEMVRESLALAIGMYFLAIIFHAADPKVNITGFTILMIFSGLTAMSASRMSSLSVVRGRQQLLFRRAWFVGIMLSTLLVVSSAVGLAFGLDDRLDWLLLVIRLPLFVVAILAVLLILPFLVLFSWIMQVVGGPTQLMDWIYESIQRLSRLVDAFVTLLVNWAEKSGAGAILAQALPYAKTILVWLLLLGIAAGLILWAALTIVQELERRKGLTPLRNADEDLTGSLRERIQRQVISARNFLSGGRRSGMRGDGKAEARIRRMYADLLNMSRALGHPRPDGHTPLEFLPTLKIVFLNLEQELQQITDAYVLVRYGQFEETLLPLEQVESAWKRVSAQGKAELLRIK